VFDAGGVRFGVLICEDAWFDEPGQAAVAAGAQLLCVLNASPFHLDKAGEREARMSERARITGRPLVYSHLVGGQDEIVFRRASFAVDAHGWSARGAGLETATLMLELAADGTPRGPLAPVPELERRPGRRSSPACATTSAKNGFPGAIIGLSGGIDSRWCWRSPSTRWAPTRCAR